MGNELTASQERELKKGINDRLNLLRKRGSNRQLGHIADVENPNRRVEKTECERAISKLHSSHDSGRAIAKRVAPTTDNGSAAIAALHSDLSLAGRAIEGPTLVAKLASAVAQAVRKDYSSAAEARRELKKLLSDEPARDIKAIAKRLEANDLPRSHKVLKSGTGKIGKVTLVEKKGAGRPYELLADGCFHSSYSDVDNAERAFVVLCAGAN